jgi:antitoxin component of MazEF toxin-antitoxin module
MQKIKETIHVFKQGDSLVIAIPSILCRVWGLEKKMALTIEADSANDRLIIRKVKK